MDKLWRDEELEWESCHLLNEGAMGKARLRKDKLSLWMEAQTHNENVTETISIYMTILVTGTGIEANMRMS